MPERRKKRKKLSEKFGIVEDRVNSLPVQDNLYVPLHLNGWRLRSIGMDVGIERVLVGYEPESCASKDLWLHKRNKHFGCWVYNNSAYTLMISAFKNHPHSIRI